jgi:TolB-like protein
MLCRVRVLLVLAFLFGGVAHAASTIAISYFDNNTGQTDLQPLSKGITDMLITDLSNVPSVQIVERAKLNQILAELKLSKTPFIDPKTALKLGKGLAADYLMTGSYALFGDELRIDVRILRVNTGAVTASEKVEGKKEEFFALEKELVDILIRTLDLKLGQAERMKLRGNATQSFAAWSAYSAGIDAADQGDSARARELFEAALRSDPGYQAARNAREKLEAIFAHVDQERLTTADQALRALDPKSPHFAHAVDQLLVGLDGTQRNQLKRKLELLKWLGERDLLPCLAAPPPPAAESPTVFRGGVPAGSSAISYCRPAHEILQVTFRFTEDPDMWDDIPAVCQYLIHRLPSDAGVMSYCRMLLRSVDSAKKQGREAALLELQEHEEWERRSLEPNDWRMALLDTTELRRSVVRLYAKKGRQVQ